MGEEARGEGQGRGGSPHLEHSALLACKCNGLFRCVLSVFRYEVELLPSGGFQYAMHAHGKTVAHSEFGADNILKFSLPDLPKDDTTARVERLAHKALLECEPSPYHPSSHPNPNPIPIPILLGDGRRFTLHSSLHACPPIPPRLNLKSSTREPSNA